MTCHLINLYLQHKPSKIIDIKFVKPKRPSSSNTPSIPIPKKKRTQKEMTVPTNEEQNAFIETIKSFFPSCAILNVTSWKIGPRTNRGVANQLPPTITHLKTLEQFKDKSHDYIESKSEALMEHLKYYAEQVQYLRNFRVLQSKSVLWFEQRKGCITASIFGAVSKTSLESHLGSLVDWILQVKAVPNVPSLEWGRTKEADSPNHTCFRVTQTGLHLHPL